MQPSGATRRSSSRPSPRRSERPTTSRIGTGSIGLARARRSARRRWATSSISPAWARRRRWTPDRSTTTTWTTPPAHDVVRDRRTSPRADSARATSSTAGAAGASTPSPSRHDRSRASPCSRAASRRSVSRSASVAPPGSRSRSRSRHWRSSASRSASTGSGRRAHARVPGEGRTPALDGVEHGHGVARTHRCADVLLDEPVTVHRGRDDGVDGAEVPAVLGERELTGTHVAPRAGRFRGPEGELRPDQPHLDRERQRLTTGHPSGTQQGCARPVEVPRGGETLGGRQPRRSPDVLTAVTGGRREREPPRACSGPTHPAGVRGATGPQVALTLRQRGAELGPAQDQLGAGQPRGVVPREAPAACAPTGPPRPDAPPGARTPPA